MAEIITPGDSYYSQARLVWNRAINKYPEKIIYCKTIEDVQKAVVYSVEKRLEIRIRGGGHHYEGFSIVNQPIPEGSEEISLNLYGLGGKISEVEKFDTAFYYRDSFYILLIDTVFKNNCYKEINKDWIKSNIDSIYRITEGSYINFPYYPLGNYMHEYYGENKYRLEDVKRKYDPYNIFNFKQSIK